MSIKNKAHLQQGEGGGGKTGKSGSHLDQGSTGATKRGPSGSHLDQMSARTNKSGSHLDPQPGLVRGKQSSQRGGGTPAGNDPSAGLGKAKGSGSSKAQNPGFPR